jgi:hypothetical protein
LQEHQLDVEDAQADLDVAKKALADEIPIDSEAQDEYNVAKSKYDAIMTSAPYLTNAVYLNIKHDLGKIIYLNCPLQ